ncbi:MAG: hypothetical protein DBX55_00090 [Verrucomicrobia bacterium]|nr:MAG: hypothetical protein DBX55_00090 [Verrucomicrobiota bacterium]
MKLMHVYGFFCYFAYAVIIPLAACGWHFKNGNGLDFGRIFVFAALYSLISWGGVLSMLYLPYFFGLYQIRGPELVFALFFGWAYLWVASLPCFVLYGLFLFVRRWRKKARRRAV